MILMYHNVFLESPAAWWVTADSFFCQLHALSGRKVVYLDNYDPSDPEQVVLTFDGVYAHVLTYAAPLLRKFRYPFELFITGDYIGLDNRFDQVQPRAQFATTDELLKLVALGGRLQWLTRTHANLKTCHDITRIDGELDIPDDIRNLDPSGFGWFAYPHGDFNRDVVEAVRKKFRGAVCCNQGNESDCYLLNRIKATNGLSLAKSRTSVIITSFNYGRYLVEAIESVLRQTITPSEILISDDCSTDDTWDIAQDYRTRYPDQIRINRNKTNLGIVAHFNTAISLTDGEYICILGADNRFRSDFLERTIQLLDRDDNVGIAYTDFALFGLRSEIVAAAMAERWEIRKVAEKYHIVAFPDFDAGSRDLLSHTNFMHGSSLFRRQAFYAVGGYQLANPRPEDHDLFRRIVDAGWKAAHCGYPLLEYRQHSREQANIFAASEALLNHYRQRHLQAEREIHELHAYINKTRGSVAWKISTPIRVLENLWNRWVKA